MKTGGSTRLVLAALVVIALACSVAAKQSSSEKAKKSKKSEKSISRSSSSEEVVEEVDLCAPAPVAVNACPLARDCAEVNGVTSGIYTIYPGPTGKAIDVYCDLETEGGEWLVFQRRLDGFTNFYRDWEEYASGFGDLIEEFWLGNHALFKITTQKEYMLRVELEDFEGEKRFAEYTLFNVGGPSQKYRLEIGGYSGDAGDSLEFHNGKPFSTYDNDNDDKSSNCAVDFQGAWWYRTCHASNLNGLYLGGANTQYGQGMNWKAWGDFDYSFKTTRMMIRPVVVE